MIQDSFTVRSNEPLTESVYKMVLEGPVEGSLTAPGQFVDLKLPGRYLRRPISVCDWDENSLTLLYKVVGHGTEDMSRMEAGTELDVLSGLGNGFDVTLSGERPLLIGGGVGIPPLYGLCKALLEQGAVPTVILGFNTASEIFLKEEFEALLADTEGNVLITTVDGTAGLKGFVTDAMSDLSYTFFYTCGPMPMFRAIEAAAQTSGQYSFEERMGCGFGACMGCSTQTKNGPKRICKEGPVLRREEIVW